MPANKTVALLVDQQEVRDQKLDCLSHMSGSKHFRQDLTLNKSAWIYTNDDSMRRCLVVQRKKPGEEDSEIK